jgi:hypothetical protein
MEIFLFYETKKKASEEIKRELFYTRGGSHTHVFSPEVREHPQVPTLSGEHTSMGTSLLNVLELGNCVKVEEVY